MTPAPRAQVEGVFARLAHEELAAEHKAELRVARAETRVEELARHLARRHGGIFSMGFKQ